jgi:hypothetical protein
LADGNAAASYAYERYTDKYLRGCVLIFPAGSHIVENHAFLSSGIETFQIALGSGFPVLVSPCTSSPRDDEVWGIHHHRALYSLGARPSTAMTICAWELPISESDHAIGD